MNGWRDERGFTVAELLAAFAVLGLVLAGVTVIHQTALQAYVSGSHRNEVQQNARVALERMAREIRATQSALKATVNATTLTLVDPVTALDVTYALTGTTLTRTTNGVTEVIIGGVQALAFAYWDANGAALSSPVGTPNLVRRVDITIRTRSERTTVVGGGADTREELTTSARLRNLS